MQTVIPDFTWQPSTRERYNDQLNVLFPAECSAPGVDEALRDLPIAPCLSHGTGRSARCHLHVVRAGRGTWAAADGS